MRPLSIMSCLFVAAMVLMLVRWAGRIDALPSAPVLAHDASDVDAAVQRVDTWLQKHWKAEDIRPAEPADDLTVLRRLSLALHGTIPSLEEIRSFSADDDPSRLQRWLQRMLSDARFADYFGERLTRMLVGNEEGPFLVYRRDRLRDWLSEQLRQDRPWSETATQLIAGDGLWTEDGHTNFLTAAFVDDEGLDENRLTSRTVRVFLGQRIDCAQCHDHFFADWKQSDFEGLAAFYGQARVTPGGVVDRKSSDGEPVEYEVVEPGAEEGRVVQPHVPFSLEWISDAGSRRAQLAAWVTHAENRRFRRAIANRVWGLMVGRPWQDPVDDLPDPDDVRDLLDVLANELATHEDRLQFLIRVIAQSQAFRASSSVPGISLDEAAAMQQRGALFPLVRLRPEQVIGSMVQAASVLTIDGESGLLTRFTRLVSENDFLKQYGEIPEDELLQQSGTIPQSLLRMNGRFTRDLTRAEIFRAAGQITDFSQDEQTAVENCFLSCLTRMPTPEEQGEFESRLRGEASWSSRRRDRNRSRAVEDLYWILFNAPEFSWNH